MDLRLMQWSEQSSDGKRDANPSKATRRHKADYRAYHRKGQDDADPLE